MPEIVDQLANARMLALTGEFQEALSIISQILEIDPSNIEALRLRGNAIELSALGEMSPGPIEDRSRDLDLALESYEAILRIVPEDTLAMKDLADHYSRFRDKNHALKLYSQLIGVLQKQETRGLDVREELREAIEDSESLKQEIF